MKIIFKNRKLDYDILQVKFISLLKKNYILEEDIVFCDKGLHFKNKLFNRQNRLTLFAYASKGKLYVDSNRIIFHIKGYKIYYILIVVSLVISFLYIKFIFLFVLLCLLHFLTVTTAYIRFYFRLKKLVNNVSILTHR